MAAAQDSEAQIVDRVLRNRRSIRRFRPDDVPAQTVRDILSAASRAPSGANMQPWQVIVVCGEFKRELSTALVAAFNTFSRSNRAEHEYYPDKYFEPYLSRRRKIGYDLYGSLGIAKTDKARRREQTARNYLFFDAPVGLIFTIDRGLKIGSWLDYGMFLQSIAVAARARGLDTCMQAAFAHMHRVLRERLSLPESRVVVCGMSLGYADKDAPENRFAVERAAVEEFAVFHGL